MPQSASRVVLWLLIFVCFSSCKRKELSWDTEILSPIMTGQLSMADLVGDGNVSENPDNSLQLVYRNDIISFKPIEIVTLPDTSVLSKFSLSSLVLDDRSIEYLLTLGRLAREIGGFTGTLILGNHGNFVPIPAIAPTSAAPVDIDASDLFEYADLDSGFMDMEIFNGFPIPITDVAFEVRNKIAGDVIFMETFDTLFPGETIVRSTNVSGKTVEGTLVGELTNIASPGSGGIPVKIDTNDFIRLNFTARDLKLNAAKAVFPAQNLVDDKSDVVFFIPGAELTYARLREGQLRVTVANTIADTLYFTYTIPRALDPLGTPVEFTTVLPPSTSGGTAEVERIFDLAGYELFLTGKEGGQVNAMYNEVVARIDSTGRLVEISLSDSIEIFYGLENLVPEYIRGYFGTDTLPIGPDSSSFSAFNSIQGGTLDLEEVEVDFSLYNEIGIDARFRLDALTGTNSRTGNSVPLSSSIVGTTQTVQRAFDNPLIPGLTTFHLDNTNSNIEAFMENLPNRFTFAGEVQINPDGNYFNHQDFAYADGPLNLSMDLLAPLSLIADDLVLVDTFDLDFGNALESDNFDVLGGELKLYLENGFPLDAELQFTFLKENGSPLFDLFAIPQTVASALLDGSCIVSSTKTSELTGVLDEGMAGMLEMAQKAEVRVKFNTTTSSACMSYLKIYSFYKFGMNMIADFDFRIKN